jgi:molecular chaperone HscC
MAIIGIDLGTTNSLCCIWQEGNCVLIPNSLGDFLTPSVVSIDENGEILTGKTAKERIITRPTQTASSFKQYMGTDKVYKLRNKAFRPEELSAIILRRLKEDAEAFLNEPVTEAIISVPAYFNNNQRAQTKLAGELAGFRVDRIINEPSAAAIAYRHATGDSGTYLVVDFGGGTLDISVVEIFENIVDIIAVAGDNHLGGDDINKAITDAFYAKYPMLKQQLSLTEQASICKMAEQCKINLSTSDQAMMMYVYKEVTYEMYLANQVLLEICTPLFSKIKTVLKHALKDSNKHINAIDEIVLVGGSGKMPLVQSFLQHLTGKNPLCAVDPDKAIAFGVAIITGIKARENSIKDMIMTDICPFTLGTKVVNTITGDLNEFSPVIERNTSLPASRARRYTTLRDNQAFLTLDIYQGESSSVLKYLAWSDYDECTTCSSR